ncbi:MAG: hypothetical protein A2551_08265 [Elusimicrobia bacterium RIFOXYD2_FULL_34_30]|nr:MAG: hypothetical protein A2551_08265 [Elusimicrobia bacterium RIFOXYD2_FULL_34_30]
MKKICLAILLICIILGLNNVFAGELKKIQKDELEIGVVLGEPTGLSFKYPSSKRNSIDFTAGLGSGFIMHFDYLWNDFKAFEVNEGKLPFYYGGGFLVAIDDKDSEFCIQGKIGIEYLFETNPLGIFIELAPAFGTDFIMQAGLGVRYRLK